MSIKRIISILAVLILIVSLAACNQTPEGDAQATPTMAPESTDVAQEAETEEVVAEATATTDPLAGLKYWEIDPDKTLYNILLLGLDALEGTSWARNDTTMILQLNLETNEMKLVSFMRDMMVDIPGYGEYRINNAHYRGGPELAVKTMKSVFDVDIDYYAVVDFESFERVMKIVGPIIVEIKDYEVASLQQYKGVVPLDGEQVGGNTVTEAGDNTLNYYQALSYARDRHSSGDNNERAGDSGRNERQREVIKSAWNAVKTKSEVLIVPSVFMASPYIETNMDKSLIITLINKMMEGGSVITDMGIPANPWAEWKDDSGTYTKDAYEALYAQKKAEFEDAQTSSEEGGESTEEAVSFPSYESWRKERGAASVIKWSSKEIYKLHDFLGIN